MTARITVFSKPDCVQCDGTYRALDKRGIDYKVVDLTQDDVALEKVRALGYMQAPVVLVEYPKQREILVDIPALTTSNPTRDPYTGKPWTRESASAVAQQAAIRGESVDITAQDRNPIHWSGFRPDRIAAVAAELKSSSSSQTRTHVGEPEAASAVSVHDPSLTL